MAAKLHTNSPTLEGEREATRFRLVLGVASLAVFAAGWGAGDFEPGTAWRILAIIIGWLAVSPLTLRLVARRAYRPWMSYVSTGADLVFASAMAFALAGARSYNFTGGALVALFFTVIMLAGVRRGARLVIVASVIAALSHLAVMAALFGDSFSVRSVYISHGGRVVQGISFVDDITKAVCMVVAGHLFAYMTRSLRASERHYHDLFESIPDGIVIANARGAVVTFNRRFSEMAGGGDGPAPGAPLGEIVDPGPPGGETATFRRADGTLIPVRIATAPMSLRGGDGIVVSVRDVSEQALLEREVARSRKMDSIGRLAGGLAHDFNNILGGILGAASLAAHAARGVPGEQGEKLAAKIGMIEDAGRSARDVVRKLLDFTRAPSQEPRRFSLAEIMADVVTLCRKTLGESIRMDVGLATESEPFVEGDEGALKQALLGLCLNAGDSLAEGGRITLRVEDAPRAEEFYSAHAEAIPGAAYVCAVVEGDGPGADAEALDRLFAPRFDDAAQAPGNGDGAGGVGSTFLKLLRQHRGFVEASPASQRGTRVGIYLPRAAAPVPAGPSGGEGAA